jgi:hypothetical protein
MKPLLKLRDTELSLKPDVPINPELSLEEIIRAHLGEFDLLALLRLLKHEGFKEQDIWFSSHNTIVSQKRVIESVRLQGKTAFVQLNLGLLAPTGILPSHIRQFIDRADIDEQALQIFFQFFDHLLVVSYLGQLYPEINQGFFTDWTHTKKCYLELQNMRSHCSLHWLFEAAFPEFTIVLRRTTIAGKKTSQPQTLGRVQLGGNELLATSHTTQGFTIYLMQASGAHATESNRQSTDYQQQLKTRLHEWVFPWLKALTIYLDVYLCVYRYSTHLKLHGHSTLGCDPLYNPADIFDLVRDEAPLHCLSLHSGLVDCDPLYSPSIANGANSSHIAEIVWGESCRIQL